MATTPAHLKGSYEPESISIIRAKLRKSGSSLYIADPAVKLEMLDAIAEHLPNIRGVYSVVYDDFSYGSFKISDSIIIRSMHVTIIIKDGILRYIDEPKFNRQKQFDSDGNLTHIYSGIVVRCLYSFDKSALKSLSVNGDFIIEQDGVDVLNITIVNAVQTLSSSLHTYITDFKKYHGDTTLFDSLFDYKKTSLDNCDKMFAYCDYTSPWNINATLMIDLDKNNKYVIRPIDYAVNVIEFLPSGDKKARSLLCTKIGTVIAEAVYHGPYSYEKNKEDVNRINIACEQDWHHPFKAILYNPAGEQTVFKHEYYFIKTNKTNEVTVYMHKDADVDPIDIDFAFAAELPVKFKYV